MDELLRTLFDSATYRRSKPQLESTVDALEDYRARGWREGLNPHPLFDVGFYLRANPDVAAASIDPWKHYLSAGWEEGRNPHPLFDTNWYRQSNRDLTFDSAPWVHYVTAGYKQARSPHPLFDAHFYLTRYADVANSGCNPLIHYVTTGDVEGRQPNPLFDTAWYRQHFLELKSDNALADYLARWWSGAVKPNAHFDPMSYLDDNVNVAAAGLEPLAHHLHAGTFENRSPNARFDSERKIELLGVHPAQLRYAQERLALAMERAKEREALEPEVIATFPPPRITCFVAMTPRTGSTLLTEWLASVGGCGLPQEYFNPEPGHPLEVWASKLRRYTVHEYVAAISRTQQSANGVFSVKTDFQRLIPFISSGALAAASVRPIFIYLSRRDLVAQAVSFHRAFETGRWSSLDGSSGEADYDLQAIRERMIFLADMMTHWERFFSVQGIEPLRLVYEDIVSNPESAVQAIARHIGVTADIDTSRIHSRTVTQRDDVSQAWSDRFREALALRV